MTAYGAISHAKTPDSATPAVETICDIFQEVTGPAFGLCNAYCEAMDCGDPNQHAANMACQRVADNFFSLTGWQLPGGYNYDSNGNLISNNCIVEPEV